MHGPAAALIAAARHKPPRRPLPSLRAADAAAMIPLSRGS